MPTPARQEFRSSHPTACSSSSRFGPKPFKRSASIDIIRVWLGVTMTVRSKQLSKYQRVSLRGVHAWGVNSTVTKHSDCFVWKGTSERVARRYDDSSWQGASQFLCSKKTFLWASSATKKSPKNPRNSLSDAELMSRFQNFAAGAAKNISYFARFKLTINCRINSNILRSYFLHCFPWPKRGGARCNELYMTARDREDIRTKRIYVTFLGPKSKSEIGGHIVDFLHISQLLYKRCSSVPFWRFKYELIVS